MRATAFKRPHPVNYLIYRKSLTSADGTTVQLNRLLATGPRPLVHFWWDETGRDSDYPADIAGVHLPEQTSWRWRSHGHLRVPLHRLLPLPILAPRVFDGRRVQDAMDKSGTRPVAAHVVVYDETQSSQASDILAALGNPPFVLHLLDVLEHDPLAPNRHRNLRQLCCRAHTVLCISELLSRAVRTASGASTQLLPVCADPYSFLLPLSSQGGGRTRIALLGTVYRRDVAGDARLLGLLGAIWPALQKTFPEAELVYAGHSFPEFPESLQPFVTNLGPLPAQACLEMLAGCALACLTASYTSASAFRYSVPSRLADFLAAGLPVIAWVSPDTAVAEFLAPLEGKCAAFVRSADELRAALAHYLGSPSERAAQGQAAREFAQRELHSGRHAVALQHALAAAARN